MKNCRVAAVMKTRWRENEELLRRNEDRWRGIDWFGLLLLLATICQDSKLCWCDIDSQTNVIAYAVILFVKKILHLCLLCRIRSVLRLIGYLGFCALEF